MPSVFDEIREALASRGYSPARLAREANKDDAFVSRVLSGKKSCPADLLAKMAEILERDVRLLRTQMKLDRLGVDARQILDAQREDFPDFEVRSAELEASDTYRELHEAGVRVAKLRDHGRELEDRRRQLQDQIDQFRAEAETIPGRLDRFRADVRLAEEALRTAEEAHVRAMERFEEARRAFSRRGSEAAPSPNRRAASGEANYEPEEVGIAIDWTAARAIEGAWAAGILTVPDQAGNPCMPIFSSRSRFTRFARHFSPGSLGYVRSDRSGFTERFAALGCQRFCVNPASPLNCTALPLGAALDAIKTVLSSRQSPKGAD